MPLCHIPRSWVEVDLEAIAHNLDIARQALPHHAHLMPVVKAGAYGHGLEPVARRLDRDGISYFGVANVGEARRLQQAGVRTPSFIMGPSFPVEREEIIQRHWSCTISSCEEADHLNRLAALYGKTLTVHLALDSGMGREGFLYPDQEDLGGFIDYLRSLEHLKIEGIMSHSPSADEDYTFTQSQIDLFSGWVRELRSHLDIRYCHLAASAGLLAYEIPEANLARPGLLLYGVAPMASIYDGVLRPTLRLRAHVCLVRELPAGHSISYGRTTQLREKTRVATVGIGYADGWSRSLSGSGVCASIQGKLCPMLGRVTMDQIMIDVTDIADVVSGSIVDLICPEQPITRVAELAGTIPWEIFTGLGPRLPRLYS